MTLIEERVGKTFGKLTILDTEIVSTKRYYTVICNCENIYKTTFGVILKNKNGCILCRNKISCPPSQATHRKSKSKEYRTWATMKSRCEGSGHDKYKNYGGRGITVDPSWNTFEQFYHDMGEAPSKLHSIDRIDNNKGYSKENCRWATNKEQSQNTRTNVKIRINDIVLCQKEWLQRMRIQKSMIYHRVKKLGWSFKDALLTPPYKTPNPQYTNHIKIFEVVK